LHLKKRTEKTPRIFEKICGASIYAIFGFGFHSVRGATAVSAVAPLGCLSAKSGETVNGGRSPFILTVD